MTMVRTYHASGKSSTALIEAVKNRHFKMTEAIIDSDARINTKDCNGENVLFALYYSYDKIIKDIKRAKNDLENAVPYCYTEDKIKEIQEKIAQFENDEETTCHLVRKLVNEDKIDIDDKSDNGKTALDEAIEINATKIAAILSGSDPDTDKSSAIHGNMNIFQAMYNENIEAIKALLKEGIDLQTVCEDKNMYDFVGKSPLGCAFCWFDDLKDIPTMILNLGADPNYRFPNEETAFSTWVSKDHRCKDISIYNGLFDLMKQKGWDFELPVDKEGNTALYYACQKGYRDIVIMLLDNGADTSCVNNRSESPLHAASKSGNKEIIKKLIEKGADINTTDNEGRTPLHLLLNNNCTDASLFLIDQGADTDIADSNGHKAIDYATAHGLREVVSRLSNTSNKDVYGNTPLHQAVYNGQSEVVRTLLQSDKSIINTTNDGGETPLVLACIQNNLVLVNLLIEAGADVCKATLNGNAPIHFAVMSNNKFIGEALLKSNAVVDTQNDNGETPLIIAAKEGYNDCVSVLLQYNANANIADNLQHTPLYYAGERGFNEIVELLLENGAE